MSSSRQPARLLFPKSWLNKNGLLLLLLLLQDIPRKAVSAGRSQAAIHKLEIAKQMGEPLHLIMRNWIWQWRDATRKKWKRINAPFMTKLDSISGTHPLRWWSLPQHHLMCPERKTSERGRPLTFVCASHFSCCLTTAFNEWNLYSQNPVFQVWKHPNFFFKIKDFLCLDPLCYERTL